MLFILMIYMCTYSKKEEKGKAKYNLSEGTPSSVPSDFHNTLLYIVAMGQNFTSYHMLTIRNISYGLHFLSLSIYLMVKAAELAKPFNLKS